MRLMFVLLPLVLAGCQGGFSGMRDALQPGNGADPAKGARAEAPEPSRELARLNASANTTTNSTNSRVLRLVAGGATGDVGVADDPVFGGRVSVQVTRDFTAASGRRCRQFIVRRLAAGAEPGHYVACQERDTWFYVDP